MVLGCGDSNSELSQSLNGEGARPDTHSRDPPKSWQEGDFLTRWRIHGTGIITVYIYICIYQDLVDFLSPCMVYTNILVFFFVIFYGLYHGIHHHETNHHLGEDLWRNFCHPHRLPFANPSIWLIPSGQCIATSAEVTPNGGLVRKSTQNSLNSGLGIILICPDVGKLYHTWSLWVWTDSGWKEVRLEGSGLPETFYLCERKVCFSSV